VSLLLLSDGNMLSIIEHEGARKATCIRWTMQSLRLICSHRFDSIRSFLDAIFGFFLNQGEGLRKRLNRR
jgi:hypothetical protein